MASLARLLPSLVLDQKGAPGHPGQGSTFLDSRSLCQPLVGLVLVQADRLFLAVKAAHRGPPILGVRDERPSLETQGARAPIGLADSP